MCSGRVDHCALARAGHALTGAPLRRLLQTKGPHAHPAKSVTQAEFVDIMKEFVAAAQAVAAQPKWRAATLGVGGPQYSFDGASAHWSVDALEELGIVGDVRFPLSPKSPDMHKVIEHVFGRLKKVFREWLYHYPAPRDARAYMEKVEHLFWHDPDMAGAHVIRKEVESLRATYDKVVEYKGGVIPKAWR